MNLEAKTLTLNGALVQYWEAGAPDAAVLVLIHGGLGDAHMHWASVLAPLAEQYRVVAPDLPGYGGSAPLPTVTADALVAWLHQFITALESGPVVVIGNSIGAWFARLYASAHADQVKALIMVNGGELPQAPPLLRWAARTPGIRSVAAAVMGRAMGGRATINDMIYDKRADRAEVYAQGKAAGPVFGRLIGDLLAGDPPTNQKPQVPTLLLWGAEDRVATLSYAKQLKKTLPGAQLQEISEAGHLPQVEAPDAFSFQVTSYLERLSEPPRPDFGGVGMLPSEQP
ncbi:MAG: alpha/beta hydrolase [Chloroflexi bacterium]|nr:alpha/beta hydrolase [Chloroflexota bacterium]